MSIRCCAEATVAQMRLTVPDVVLDDAEVDSGMEELRRRHVAWEPVARAAALGDQVHFRYTAGREDEEPAGIPEEGPDVVLTLQSGEVLQELHEHLAGMCAGEEKVVRVRYKVEPGGQPPSEMEGKCRLRMSEVRQGRLPDWGDSDWLGEYGDEGMTRDKMREAVRRHLDARQADLWREYMREEILRVLTDVKESALPVPSSLLKWCLSTRLKELGVQSEQELLKAENKVRRIAQRDAQLLTVFRALIDLSGVEPTEQDLERVEEVYAGRFRDPSAARRHARQDPDVRRSLKHEATWAALIRWTLDRATVNKERMNLRQLQAGVNK